VTEPAERERSAEDAAPTAPSTDAGAAPPPALSEPVRARVVALAADALGRLAPEHLPVPLKRVASFAPARRARLAGSQIAAVLESDDAFRERVAGQVRAQSGAVAEALSRGEPPVTADPVDVAASAYLLRPEGWRELVCAADEEARRLRRRVAELQEEAVQLRQRSREQVERVKAENAELRRKLGDVRTRLRDAERETETTQTSTTGRLRAADQAVAAAEAEVRRLRARVAALEDELGAVRRAERASKVEETVRARLLVETLVSAAQGLQRELGLPSPDRLPADTVAAEEAEEGSRTSTGRGSLAVDDPTLLEELLRLPRAHLVVDGYNVSKTAWPELPLERQRERLLTGAASLLARTGAEVTVVFDAAGTRNRPVVPPPRGVRVLFSPFGVIADDVIRDLVAVEPPGRAVVVASSDQAVCRDVLTAGFRVVGAAALVQVLTR
jgi:predicted RNA-binding protein with PIN domain